MKRIALAALALLIALLAVAGCGEKAASIEGIWTSADGSTLTISDGMLILTDSMGASLIEGAPLPCEHRGDFLYVEIDGVDVKVFEASLDGDSLTLTYTIEIQADMQTSVDQSIELTRSEG